MLCLFFCG